MTDLAASEGDECIDQPTPRMEIYLFREELQNASTRPSNPQREKTDVSLGLRAERPAVSKEELSFHDHAADVGIRSGIEKGPYCEWIDVDIQGCFRQGHD
uniref:hypothetical protein n=1 Tax=Rhizobium rhizogenes TaxID=359 RepID=UPI001F417AB2|nr:hypothetical protein [Rhizobium rhizogenes]